MKTHSRNLLALLLARYDCILSLAACGSEER